MSRTIALLALVLSTSAFAGGSISKEDAAKEIQALDPALASIFSELRLDSSGNAGRDSEGKRILPFEFTGKSKDGRAISVFVDKQDSGKLGLGIESN